MNRIVPAIRVATVGLVALMLLTLAALPAPAQVQTGTPPFSSTQGGGTDSVNLGNLNVHLVFPILHKPGRNLPFNFDIAFDTTFWQPIQVQGTKIWYPGTSFMGTTGPTSFGWSGSPLDVGGMAHLSGYDYEYYFNCENYYVDGAGTPHAFVSGYTDNQWSPALWGCALYDHRFGYDYPQSAVTSDGSGYLLNQDICTWVNGNCYIATNAQGNPVPIFNLSSADGNHIVPLGSVPVNQGVTAGSVIDRNGNEITVDQTGRIFTDTLGTTALTTSGAAPNPYVYQYTDSNGNPASVTVTFAPYTVATGFRCSGVADYPPTQVYLVDRITLQDGSFYKFTYEPTGNGAYTARLASITLPTGGTISYTYGGINCSDGSALVLTRTTPDGTWSYSRSLGSGAASTTTVIDPASNQTVINFQNPAGYGYGAASYETQRNIYQGSSSLIETITTCYNGHTTNCPTTALTLPFTQQTVFTHWTGGNNGPESRRDTFYNSFGLPTERDEYDYASQAPGALLRKITVAYHNFGSGSSLNSMPDMVMVIDGSNNIKAQTTYGYDQTGLTTTSAPQHVTFNGSRGNVTTITRIVQGASTVSRTTTYFDTGEVQTSNDFNNNPTTYAYSSAYGNAYPTTVTNALNQSTSAAYDVNTGLVTSSTDLNGNTTSFQYDSMLRPTETDYPDGGQTRLAYPSPNEIDTTQKIDASRNETSTQLFDGLGRPIQTQLTSDPGGTDLVDTTYDSFGRVHTVSNPHRSGSSSTDGVTTYTYDALGRPTSITDQDGAVATMLYSGPCPSVSDEAGVTHAACPDGLGRLVSVGEDPGGSPNLNYWTGYTYDALDNLVGVTQFGSRQRTFTYDGLSRVLTATNPESGTTTFTYDANSNLISKVDARGITTCFGTWSGSSCNGATGYDALNRNLLKTFSDGTTAESYQYDRANGQSVPNGIGRLTAAIGGSAQGCTGDYYQYDPMGRITSRSSSAPANCGTGSYTVTAGYDLLGDITSYTNGQGVTFSRQFDTAGRPTQVTSSLSDSNHPPTLFSSAQYNTLGQLASATLGNGAFWSRAFNNRTFVQATRVATSNGTPGTGSATVSGTEQSRPGGTPTPGTGTVYISGSEQVTYTDPCNQYEATDLDQYSECESYNGYQNQWIYDSGTVTFTIGIYSPIYINYGQGDTANSVAANLASAINGAFGVSATASGNTVTITSTTTGSSTNYPISASAQSNDSWAFNAASFDASAGGLDGGTDGNPTYDAGSVWLTINGTQCSTAYGNGDTSSSLATKLANAVNSCSSVARAVASGGTLNLTSTTLGSGANYSLSAGSSSTQSFSPPSFSLSTSGGQLVGGAGASGQVLYSYSLGRTANGSVSSVNDMANGIWSYTYDPLNRLASATQSGQPSYTYAYDTWGNRINEKYNGSCTSGVTSCLTFDANNHVSGGVLGYDAAGDVTSDAAHAHYYYNAEGRLIQVDGTLGNCSSATACYTYDAEGRRVAKTTSSGTVSYVYDLAEGQAAEVNSSGAWTRGEVYLGGMHLATYTGGTSGTTYFDHADWVGTERVRSNVSDAACETMTSLPFGEGLNTTGACNDASPLHFTGYMHDGESGLDDANARFYGSSLGRFTRPDPLGIGSADLTNPQSLNEYAYVMNNPLNMVDPTGLCGDSFDGSGCGGGGGFGGAPWGEDPPLPGPDLPGYIPGHTPFPTPGGGFNWRNWLFGPGCQPTPAGNNPCIQSWHPGPMGQEPDNGDKVCAPDGTSCHYWNVDLGVWQSTPPPDEDEKRIKSVAKQVSNVDKGVAEIYGASVIAGACGGVGFRPCVALMTASSLVYELLRSPGKEVGPPSSPHNPDEGPEGPGYPPEQAPVSGPPVGGAP